MPSADPIQDSFIYVLDVLFETAEAFRCPNLYGFCWIVDDPSSDGISIKGGYYDAVFFTIFVNIFNGLVFAVLDFVQQARVDVASKSRLRESV